MARFPSSMSQSLTNVGADGAAVTLTIPAPPAGSPTGIYHHIGYIQVILYNTAARTGGATPVTVTTTNLPGSNAFTFPSAGLAGAVTEMVIQPTGPIRSLAPDTATTIVCPATTGILWRVNVFLYYAGD